MTLADLSVPIQLNYRVADQLLGRHAGVPQIRAMIFQHQCARTPRSADADEEFPCRCETLKDLERAIILT